MKPKTIQKHGNVIDDDVIFKRHLANATDGCGESYRTNILRLNSDNATLIVNFLNDCINHENITTHTKQNKIMSLVRFMKFLVKKHGQKEISFKDVSRDDLADFQDSVRNPPTKDPLHKWIGTYNQYLRNIKTFYRWINDPDEEPKNRKSPEFLEGINQLHRKEITTYKPSDMWTEEEDAIFLRYCEDPRIRCYHMMAKDTSARPHELLVKRIGDFVEAVAPNGVKYMKTSVGAGGKTKQRPVSLYHSYPHYLEWLSHHSTPTDPTAFVFRSFEKQNKYRNVPLSTQALDTLYLKLKRDFFPRLLNQKQKIPDSDKKIIKILLQKPWNPYVRRHTALTEKVSKINEWNLKQHAGWTKTSNMINKYSHELGDTSNDAVLSSCFGIEIKSDSVDSKLKPKQCGVCGTSNRHDAQYCVNAECKRMLSFEAHQIILDDAKKETLRIESLVEAARKETEQKFVTQLEQMQQKLEERDKTFKDEIKEQIKFSMSSLFYKEDLSHLSDEGRKDYEMKQKKQEQKNKAYLRRLKNKALKVRGK